MLYINFSRTGLFAESHGIVANVGTDMHDEFYPLIRPIRTSGTRSPRLNFITTAFLLHGIHHGGSANRFVHPLYQESVFTNNFVICNPDVGDRRESRYQDRKPNVVGTS